MRFLLLILLNITFLFGYTFKCLDDCECDTDNEIIHCHNLALENIKFPQKRLRGFIVLGLTHNNLHYLPSEELLLEKFPDLKGVDVEGNTAFDCDTLDHYKKLAIFSDCGKSEKAGNHTSEDFHIVAINEPTNECNLECQIIKHTKSLTEYAKHLWTLLLQKLEELERSKAWGEVKEAYRNLKKVISNHLNI
uniref:LRRNT domain-containing protein n=1 Tax=Parastrongyloides trichosuri TaxID=131310 RepID=A0A0N4ZI65_PARTI